MTTFYIVDKESKRVMVAVVGIHITDCFQTINKVIAGRDKDEWGMAVTCDTSDVVFPKAYTTIITAAETARRGK